MTEIIVEFPSPFTEREKKMIFGYKGELIRCKYCQSWKENTCNLPEHNWCGTLQMLTHAGDYCAWSPNLDEDEE